MLYELAVNVGISWGGCGSRWTSKLPQEECFKALAAVRFDDIADGDSRRSSVVFCLPVPQE